MSERLVDHVAAERIHAASLELLRDPGVRIEHDAIGAMLRRAGASDGVGAQVLRVPPELVRDALATAPSEVFLADRCGGGRRLASGVRPSVWSVPGMGMLHRGVHRAFTSADMAAFTRLLDRLPEVDGVFGLAMEDVPPAARDAVGLRIMAENTRKHIRVLCFSPEGADALCAMRDVVGDFPWFSVGFTAHGPLRWTWLALEIFARTAGRGIPATINGEPMAGVSAPVTLAGAAVVGNAEILAGLVINQLLEPGRPCIYNLGLAHVFDMRTAIAVTGGPENHLLAGIAAAMGEFYGLPSCSWVSTEAMCADAQAALEKSLGFEAHFRAGVSLVWGVGQLESEMTVSPAQAVIDNEIIGYVRRLHRGVEVTDESLALAVAREVGIGGQFLDHEHTMAHFRTELFEPSLLCRVKRDAWTAAGSQTLAAVAEARAEELMRPLEQAEPLLTDEQRTALQRIADHVACKESERRVD